MKFGLAELGKKQMADFSLSGLDKKQMGGFVFAYVIIILLLSFLIKGRAGSFRKTSIELSKQQAAVKEAEELIENRVKYQQEIDDLEKRIKIYEAKLPEQREVPQVFRKLDKVAGQSQIKIKEVGEEESEEREHYQRYWMSLELEGGYHELGRFINKLESSDRFIKVDDIQMSSSPENLLKHNIKLTVSTFVSKETI